MPLEPGHVRIAEQSQALRPERSGELRAARDIAHRLGRQPVHQVNIETIDTGLAQPVGGLLHEIERLDAADGSLYVRRSVLHAETGARNADGLKRVNERPVDAARVEFDGV